LCWILSIASHGIWSAVRRNSNDTYRNISPYFSWIPVSTRFSLMDLVCMSSKASLRTMFSFLSSLTSVSILLIPFQLVCVFRSFFVTHLEACLYLFYIVTS
jgi:hypothetical protein